MNGHVNDGELIAYLDGELTGAPTTRLAAHLRECAACRRGLDELRSASRRLTAALERIDRPPPRSLRPPVIRPRSAAEEEPPRVAAASPGTRRWWIAAALVLAAGTAAAAVPGSPVRSWLEHSFGAAGDGAPPAATVREAEPTPPPGAGETAVALRADGPLAIIIREPSADARVRVRLVDGARASVRATGARYRTARNRIEVLGPEAGELRISIPRDVPAARVEVDGRVLVRKEGGDLRVLTPADTVDSEVVFRLGGGAVPEGQ